MNFSSHLFISLLLLGLTNFHKAAAVTITSTYSSPNGNGTVNDITINDKVITLKKTFNKFGSIDIFFTINPGLGNNNNFIFVEEVTNNTGIIWKDYHFELLVFQPQRDNPTTFIPVPSTPNDNLSFNDTPKPAATQNSGGVQFPAFDDLKMNKDRIDWDGGTIGNGDQVNFSFVIDVPNNLIQSQFGIRQTPSCKCEPHSFFLRNSGLAMIGFPFFLAEVSCPSVCRPIPEPSSILGLTIALGFGTFLKKQHSRKLNKRKLI